MSSRGGLILLAPLCLAWVGSGEGELRWARGEELRPAEAEVVAKVLPGRDIEVVATIALPDFNDAVLTLWFVDDPGRDTRYHLPDDRVQVTYEEFDEAGVRRFDSEELRGQMLVSDDGVNGLSVEVTGLLVHVEHPKLTRRIVGLELDVTPVEGTIDYESSGGHHDDGRVVVSGGGCDDSASSSSGGCEGDDLGGDSGGCEGDDLGGDSGGCEGDDLAGSSGGCEGDGMAEAGGGCGEAASGCSGDAIASSCPRKPRSRVAMRAVAWSPYAFAVLFIIGLRRRGARRV